MRRRRREAFVKVNIQTKFQRSVHLRGIAVGVGKDGYMKPKCGNDVELCYTDSFIYEIRTEDFHEDIREDVPTMFDTSAYPEDHPSGLPRVNKKVPGLMKDEAAGSRNSTRTR